MEFRICSILRYENYKNSKTLTVDLTGYYSDKCDISFMALVPIFKPKSDASIESIRIRYRSQLNKLKFDSIIQELVRGAGGIEMIIFCIEETRAGKIYKEVLSKWFKRNGHEIVESNHFFCK